MLFIFSDTAMRNARTAEIVSVFVLYCPSGQVFAHGHYSALWKLAAGTSAPVAEGPDFGSEGNQGQRILEFECPLGGFVPKNTHAEQTAGPSTNSSEQNKA
jgi:hypothetical protein